MLLFPDGIRNFSVGLGELSGGYVALPDHLVPNLDLSVHLMRIHDRGLNIPRILCIDDDPVYCKMLSGYARQQGLVVRTLSPVDDLSMIESADYDVAIIDYDLGTVTGSQLSKMLSSFHGEIPTLLISSYRAIDTRQWSPATRGFVSKSEGLSVVLLRAVELFETHYSPSTN